MQIDAHQHYWNPARGDYGWMPKGDGVLDRVYGPEMLDPILVAEGIGCSVLVQAAPTLAETEYLLDIAARTASVAAVVGWTDFEDSASRRDLERLKEHPKFRGVRPMIQDIPDDDWMLGECIRWAFGALTELDLTFDLLGFPRHIPNALRLLERHPDLRVVIDHCMKPQIGRDDPAHFAEWAEGMARLARETAAYVKLSGLVTEDGPGWTAERLRPWVDHVIDAFGPARVMWGSDWPVARLRTEYAGWRSAAKALTAQHDDAARARIFGGTAAEFYRIG